ncbi:MAG: XRE family transcriptional regulator [Pseudomonadota bacterium]|nr:XRE family transcriptional regulator [Pseudomonadota bacterium]
MTQQTFVSVWDALEDSPEMAENMKIRSALMIELQELVRSRGWAQEEAAGHFGVTQPRLNDLLRGSIDKFSLDALVLLAARAGLAVQLQIKQAA